MQGFHRQEVCRSANEDLCVHQSDPARHIQTGFHLRQILPLYETLSILKVKITLSVVQNPRPRYQSDWNLTVTDPLTSSIY